MAAAPPITSLGPSRATGALTTSVTPLFVLGGHPGSLEASIVTVSRPSVTARPDSFYGDVTYALACPTAASPANDACRAAGIYPAQAHHSPGSVFAGAYTSAGTTTAWQCALGGSSGSQSDKNKLSANCVKTIGVADGPKTTESVKLDECGILSASVAVVITAGLEKELDKGVGRRDWDAATYRSFMDAQLSSAGCKPLGTMQATATTRNGSGVIAGTPTPTGVAPSPTANNGTGAGTGAGAGSETTPIGRSGAKRTDGLSTGIGVGAVGVIAMLAMAIAL